MRIRKRHVLLSSQHFPVTSPSDPHLNNRSPVVVQLGDATSTAPEPSSPQQQRSSAVLSLNRNQPSGKPLPPINGLDHRRQHGKQDPSAEDGGGREEEEEKSGEDSEEKKGNHSRKGRIFGSSQILLPPPPSTPQDDYGRWCEEEKAIPFKKRRGAFENNGVVIINDNTSCIGQLGITSSSSKKTKAKMKTKMNKKCSLSSSSSIQNHDGEDDKKAVREAKPNGGGGGKKRGRGSALMEGSRCSRVNGRGWRCLQQTLVGYSLCEHHLGKGRLRSMTSVRSRSTSATTTTTSSSSTATAPSSKVVMVVQQDHHHHTLLPASYHDGETNLSLLSSSPPDEKQIDKCVVVAAATESDDDDDEKPVVIMTTTKKRMKLGTVKARSISSLLGQTPSTTTNTGIALAHESNTNK